LCYSSFLLSPWADAASSASGGFVSELEDPGQPFAWLYRTSDVLAGLGILTAAGHGDTERDLQAAPERPAAAWPTSSCSC
jgi:hypothetical protein